MAASCLEMQHQDPVEAINHQSQDKVRAVIDWLEGRIIGQPKLIERLVMTLICGGHLLVEGAPGLAKTRAIKELASAVEGDFHRIQFTPDLLPSDVTGTEIFRPEDGSFKFQRGPIFHNLLLADEINRSPAKVQSALLEAMAERQVSVGRETYRLPELFLVMATQNPIEQEGTYPLPEAQLDRFLMHTNVGYPDAAAEHRILELVRGEVARGPNADTSSPPPTRLGERDVFDARRAVLSVYMSPSIEEYIVQLILATRSPELYDADLAGYLEYGASPRGTIALDICSRASAWLDGRDYVAPEDVHSVCHDTLRHRIITSFEAEAQSISADDVIDRLVARVPVP
jgi:MoxR-like ATPase